MSAQRDRVSVSLRGAYRAWQNVKWTGRGWSFRFVKERLARTVWASRDKSGHICASMDKENGWKWGKGEVTDTWRTLESLTILF